MVTNFVGDISKLLTDRQTNRQTTIAICRGVFTPKKCNLCVIYYTETKSICYSVQLELDL